MATLEVAIPFTVQLDLPPPARDAIAPQTAEPVPPHRYVFPVPGIYEDVPDDVAGHPYTQAHLVGYEAPPPAPWIAGTVIMEPVEEPPPTQDEATAALSREQRAEIAKRRRAEEAAARKPPPSE